MTRVRTVFFGSGRFGVESLRRLAASDEVALVGVVLVFVLAMAGVLLLVGRTCFQGRPSFLDMMSELPLTPAEAAARRRDVAVDDESRR